ncbi:uncharacterized protein [Macrobrachium rosenbergii]|uniref:uncharacterized protein n=1 Tax=Macrobrachium rosenbergii TaxID=79674 RepID=UPI0034D42DF5
MGLCGERTCRSRCSCCCHKLSIFLFTILLLLLPPVHVVGQQTKTSQPDTLPQLDDVTAENISLTTSAIDTGTKGADEKATGEPHTPELTAEESASAPIFVTIVQRHKEADYFIDNHHPYHPPPPPPPPPPVYHPEPHYHNPHPPLKYHPTPEYYPPPPPPPPVDYYHYEKESKYYHASDYHEPSYHKPKFVHDIKYVEEHEHYPPPPPPLPLPKHEKGYHYAPPVYHAKSYHETKVQHDYVPPPPPPPKVYHEPVIVHKGHHHKKDYYIPEPEYHHPAPTTYEYSVKIYDRKDDFEPEYYDLPKAYHPGYEEPIKEVKHEYKKGSRSFEHSVSKLPPVHIVADDLYDPPPPHGFIKAKYEKPASYSPPHHHRYNKDHPLPKTSYHTSHYKDSVPVPPPLPPPPELTEDSYEVPLPAPLPSLEDVDPLIFDPILPYNAYFEDASRIAVGDEFPSSDLPNTPLPREYPFLFDLDPNKHYSSQIPNVHTSITNTPKLTFTYYPPTFPAEEEAEEEEEDSLQQGLTTASMYSNPELHTSVSTGIPVTLSSNAQSSPTLTTASESVPPKPRVTEPSTSTQQPLTTVVSVLNFPEKETSTPSSAMTITTSIITTNSILTEKTTDSVTELSSNAKDETDLQKPVTELTTLESLPKSLQH